MGNVLNCFKGEEDQYPYYLPTSRPHYQPPYYYSGDQPSAAPRPRPHQQALGPHGVRAAPAGVADLDQNILNFKSTSMIVRDITYLQGRTEVLDKEAVTHQSLQSTVDIDESSAEELCDAESYVKANAMLIEVEVLGRTTKTFWRLSDEATRISRKLALILRSYHSVNKYLAAPLRVSNIWISSSGSVKLRGVRFSDKRFSLKRVQGDYRDLSRVLHSLIRISGGDVTNLPPDYKEFLNLLMSDTLSMKDEFWIVNNPALLPMSNRTGVFLMLYDMIITYLGRTKKGKAKKKRILSKLPYKQDWLDTATANEQINQWVVNVKTQYRRTQLDLLRLNRNVRSHLREYNDDNIEQVLYCEWPELLMQMAKQLYVEGELQGTEIENKFG